MEVHQSLPFAISLSWAIANLSFTLQTI
jgi:hypothetical protein